MPALDLVGSEIATIEGEDLSCAQFLCRHHQGGVGQVHRVMAVSLHELERTLERRSIQKPNR